LTPPSANWPHSWGHGFHECGQLATSHSVLVLTRLLGAVLFVGAIALEVFVLEPMRKHIRDESFQEVEFYLFRTIKRRDGVAVLPLFVTGWQGFRIDRFAVVHIAAVTLGLSLVVLGKLLWMA
jgi:hypothetical protein